MKITANQLSRVKNQISASEKKNQKSHFKKIYDYII